MLLLLTIFHLSLGDLGISFCIWLYEAIQPFLNTLMVLSTLFVGIGILGGLVAGLVGVWRRDWDNAVVGAKALGSGLILSILPAIFIFQTVHNKIQLVPDLAVTVDERDQLAALIAGSMAMAYTCYTVWRDRNLKLPPPTEAELEEMQPLNGTEAGEEGNTSLQQGLVSPQQGEQNV